MVSKVALTGLRWEVEGDMSRFPEVEASRASVARRSASDGRERKRGQGRGQ